MLFRAMGYKFRGSFAADRLTKKWLALKIASVDTAFYRLHEEIAW
jgi:hypothetical protein